MKCKLAVVLSLAAISLFLAVPAFANYQPLVNLGATSFLDGGPPAGPGFYFSQYLLRYDVDEILDQDGKAMQIPTTAGIMDEPDLSLWVSLSQLIYQSDTKIPLIGAKWGMNLILPYVGINLEPEDLVIGENGAGIGDLLVGPYIQWDPIMGSKGPIFMHRVEFQVILPLGKYDEEKALNPGSNFLSFNPYWAGTLFILPKWTASWRAHYLWNAENDEPFIGLQAQGVRDVQVGQAVHVNFATEYEILEKRLRFGLNGYYLKQLTDTEFNGKSSDDYPGHENANGYREQVLAIGPGAVIHFNQNNHLFLNAYFEMEAENRTEGFLFNARLVHHF